MSSKKVLPPIRDDAGSRGSRRESSSAKVVDKKENQSEGADDILWKQLQPLTSRAKTAMITQVDTLHAEMEQQLQEVVRDAIRGLMAEEQRLKGKIAELEHDRESLSRELNNERAATKALEEKLATIEESNRGLTTRLQSLEAQLQQDSKGFAKREKALKAELQEQSDKVKELTLIGQKTKDALTERNVELQKAEGKLKQKQGLHAEQAKEMKKLQAEVIALKDAQQRQRQASQTKAKSESASLKAALSEAKEQVEQLKHEAAKHQSDSAAAARERETLSQQLAAVKKSHKISIKEKVDQIEALEQQLQQLHLLVSSLKAQPRDEATVDPLEEKMRQLREANIREKKRLDSRRKSSSKTSLLSPGKK